MKKSFKEKLVEKVQEAQVQKNKDQEKAMEKLLGNDKFVETQRATTAKQSELTKLNEIIAQLNSITPYTATDGRKFSINVFPSATFGVGYGAVMGIIVGSRSAFIDEKMMEYSAISGISMLELYESLDAIGSPAYYKDGKVHDATVGDFAKLKNLLEGIFISLDLHELEAKKVTKEKYDLWFALAETRATKALTEHETLQDLEENAKDFILDA